MKRKTAKWSTVAAQDVRLSASRGAPGRVKKYLLLHHKQHILIPSVSNTKITIPKELSSTKTCSKNTETQSHTLISCTTHWHINAPKSIIFITSRLLPLLLHERRQRWEQVKKKKKSYSFLYPFSLFLTKSLAPRHATKKIYTYMPNNISMHTHDEHTKKWKGRGALACQFWKGNKEDYWQPARDKKWLFKKRVQHRIWEKLYTFFIF